MTTAIVADAGPLIGLGKIGRLPLLQALYGTVLIPPCVHEELRVGSGLPGAVAAGRAIVEGVNFIKRHTRRSQKNPQGGIIEREAPIHASNVKVVCAKCGEPARIGRKVLENKKRVRVCKSCGEMLVSST